MTTFKNRFVAASAAIVATLATVGAAAPGRAATLENVQSVSVRYAESAVATPAGQADLASRIRRAAKRVCGPIDIANHVQVAQCRRNAIAQGNADVQVALARRTAQRIAMR